jgi:hypothetical protein
MSIDLLREPGIPLSEVPKLPWLRGRGGRRLHLATIHRWCSRGIRGTRLEFVQRGGTRVTTEAALLRFFAGLTGGRLPESTGAARQRLLMDVDRELDARRI